MSNETYITVRGYVGSVPAIFGSDPQRCTVVIRVGVTARRFNREAEEYTNGETAWYSVRCYGTLGQHVVKSIHRGTPVLVRGRLVPRIWADKDGVQRTEFNILADAVGIELSTGIAHFVHARLTELPALEGEPGSALAARSENAVTEPSASGATASGLQAGPQPEGSYSISGAFENDPRANSAWETNGAADELDGGADAENLGSEGSDVGLDAGPDEGTEYAGPDAGQDGTLSEALDPAGNLAGVYS